MAPRRAIGKDGMTLVEVMVAVAITAVASIGALTYQYHAARQSSMGRVEMAAARISQLLLEDWRSTGGDVGYDPSGLGLGFEGTEVGNASGYSIVVDDTALYVTLAARDVAYDAQAGVTLRQISVTTTWRSDFGDGDVAESDPSLSLASYVRLDGAGG